LRTALRLAFKPRNYLGLPIENTPSTEAEAAVVGQAALQGAEGAAEVEAGTMAMDGAKASRCKRV
jgi:hypothetical protein